MIVGYALSFVLHNEKKWPALQPNRKRGKTNKRTQQKVHPSNKNDDNPSINTFWTTTTTARVDGRFRKAAWTRANVQPLFLQPTELCVPPTAANIDRGSWRNSWHQSTYERTVMEIEQELLVSVIERIAYSDADSVCCAERTEECRIGEKGCQSMKQ